MVVFPQVKMEATHQCCEDIALMRTIPGMTVIVPSDDIEAKAVKAAAMEGPVSA